MATNDFTDIKVYGDATVTGNIELGNADTTISRSSAGIIAVEGEIIPSLTRVGTFSAGIKTFLAGVFALRNVANTFSAFFTNTNTADRTYTLPDKNGTVAMTSDITGTNSGTNTGDQTSIVGITGTIAQFNTAITDGDLATGGGTATGTNTGDNATNTQYSGLAASKQDVSAKDATGGYAGLTLFKINIKNAANTFTNFFTNATTAARTWTFPDKDGTVAMTSDITGTNSGTNTGDQTSIVGITGTIAQFNTAITDGDLATGGGTATGTNTGDETLATIKSKLGITTLSGSNTGDQASIVGLTGTKAEFNAAVTDGNFNFSLIGYSAISTSSAITVGNVYGVNCTTGNIVLTLSTGTTIGDVLTVKKVDNSSNTITINSIGIDGSTSVIIDTQDESLDLFWNGTSFLII